MDDSKKALENILEMLEQMPSYSVSEKLFLESRPLVKDYKCTKCQGYWFEEELHLYINKCNDVKFDCPICNTDEYLENLCNGQNNNNQKRFRN